MKLPSYQLLSKEQDRINGLPLSGNYLVTGPPGTGKSVMALYRASLLQKKKKTVRLIMFSHLLMMYMRSAIDDLKLDNVSVVTMHQWVHRYFQERYRSNPPMKDRWGHDWQAIMLRLQADGHGKDAPNVIVDEGQDLPKEFFIMARLASDHLTVFADENQRINPGANCKIEEIRAYAGIKDVYELRRNYRNTREIAAVAARFYTGLPTGIPDAPERSGPKPSLNALAGLPEEIEFVARYERNNSDLEIGVLLPSQALVGRFERDLRGRTKNPVRKYVRTGGRAPEIRFEAPGALLLTYQSAKGLEFDTVFMPALAEATDDPSLPETRMRLYVLISRARDNLYFTYSGSGEPPLVRVLLRLLQ